MSEFVDPTMQANAPIFAPATTAPQATEGAPVEMAVAPTVDMAPDGVAPQPIAAPVAPPTPPVITESLQASLNALTIKKNALKQNASDRLRVIQADGSSRLSSLKVRVSDISTASDNVVLF